MQALTIVGLGFLFLTATSLQVVGQDGSPENADYPGTVALSHVDGQWMYKSFPDFLPLYVFDGDTPGRSNCDEVCSAVWPLLKAKADDTSIGDWTVINRDDGRRQWAYKGWPVYTFFEDTAGEPNGIGMSAEWYYEKGVDEAAIEQKKVVVKNDGNKPIWRLLVP